MICWATTYPPLPETTLQSPNDRHVRFNLVPPINGITTQDHKSHHQDSGWPPKTEYQYAYGGNKRSQLWETQLPRTPMPTRTPQNYPYMDNVVVPSTRGSRPIYPLYEITPLPIVDKHIRGAHYHPDDPLGVQVPEEWTKGMYTVNTREKAPFLPSYRYKEFVARPFLKIKQNLDVDEYFPVSRVPDVPGKHFYDFYHEVRMGRKAPKHLRGEDVFLPSRVFPLPMNHNIPNIPPVEYNPFLGRFNNYGH